MSKKNGWIGSHIVVDYCDAKGKIERFSGIVENCRFIAKSHDYLYTVKLDNDEGYRNLYLDSERTELIHCNEI